MDPVIGMFVLLLTLKPLALYEQSDQDLHCKHISRRQKHDVREPTRDFGLKSQYICKVASEPSLHTNLFI